MADKKTSPLMQQHLRDLATKDFSAGLPERPPAPQRPAKLQKPMGGMIRGTVFVDGQAVGPTPAEWAELKKPALKVNQSAPLTEEEVIRERRERKKRERDELQARMNQPDRAPRKPPPRPMSAAVKNHFWASLIRPDPKL